MRIYDGSPRQDWEEVLRSIGAYADHQQLKELLFVELEPGFILQGLTQATAGRSDEGGGHLVKKTFEIEDDQAGKLMDDAAEQRGTSTDPEPHLQITNYYEQALRVIGKYIDGQKARDVFFFEQEGSFVVRLLTASGGGALAHQLAEFTRDEIVAMIEVAPQSRDSA
jgi:hypothetical protein